MKLMWIIVALNVLSARAQNVTNQSSFVAIDSLDAARGKNSLGMFSRIATNTPAFERYAVNFMLIQANALREKWKLDIAHPMTINDIWFQLNATPYGIDGLIETRDSRYMWQFTRFWLTQFKDRRYWPRSFQLNDDEASRLAKLRSRIDAREAEKIAHDALNRLGFTDRGLGLINPAEVSQYKFEETNGIVYQLPMFNVTWRVEGYDDSGTGITCLKLDISGTTKRVAEYMNFDPHAMPRLPVPTNYFEMLNLPTNYLDTVSPHQRELWGLPPLGLNPGK